MGQWEKTCPTAHTSGSLYTAYLILGALILIDRNTSSPNKPPPTGKDSLLCMCAGGGAGFDVRFALPLL